MHLPQKKNGLRWVVVEQIDRSDDLFCFAGMNGTERQIPLIILLFMLSGIFDCQLFRMISV